MQLAVLASGSGTILESLLADALPIVVVATDRACRALDVAAQADVAAVLVARERFDQGFDRAGYTRQVLDALEPHAVDLVVMAGFGTVLSAEFFERYPGRVLNTHPALLPSFKGWHAVRDALAYGVKVTGCTVHVATAEVDHGPILAQEPVRVLPDDDEATLHERIKTVERELYRATIRHIIERGSVL